MIHIDRNQIAEPRILRSDTIRQKYNQLERVYFLEKAVFSQSKSPVLFDEKLRSDLLPDLFDLFKGKCAYCETRIFRDKTAIIDHFRPRSRAQGDAKTVKVNHYWWLTFEWRNLYLCCPDCNRFKGSWFPVRGAYCEERESYERISTFEKPLLIDPCKLKPEEHLDFETDGRVSGLTAQGRVTIENLQLNRDQLIKQRLEVIWHESAKWEEILNNWKNEKNISDQILDDWNEIVNGSSGKVFLAARRALIKDRLNFNSEIASYFNKKYDNPFDPKIPIETTYFSEAYSQNIHFELPESIKMMDASLAYNSAMPKFNRVYLSRLELQNFRCFDELQIEFPKKGQKIEAKPEDIQVEPWFSILGENGVGKSTILQAISLALAGNDYIQDNFKNNHFLKDNRGKGFIKLWLEGNTKPITVNFSRTTINSTLEGQICYCLGYGSVRLVDDGKKQKKKGPVNILNLFNPRVEISNPEDWIYKVDDDTFNRVSISLKNLLALSDRYRIERNKVTKGLMLSGGNSDISIEILSEGYKSVIYLCLDIIRMFVSEKEEFQFEQAEGIILIDELGTHLHPRWKMQVVEKLRTTFPRLQFIVTTHEPLCLVGVYEGEVISLLRDTDENILLKTALPSPSSMRVDQLLTSEFFGLNSTINPKMDRLFNEYYQLLAIPDEVRTSKDIDRITELQPEINQHNHLGNSLREELAYFVIDELLAKKVRNHDVPRPDLEQEILSRVKKMWDSLD